MVVMFAFAVVGCAETRQEADANRANRANRATLPSDPTAIHDMSAASPDTEIADRAAVGTTTADDASGSRTHAPEAVDAALELRWSIAQDEANGFTDLEIMQAWAGANRGPMRDENWVRVPVAVAPVRPLGTDPEGVVAAHGVLPAGSYDRVHVAAIDVRGRDPSGMWVSLVNHIEPIARGFDVEPGGRMVVTIDLVVRPPSSTGDGRSEMFVRDARLAAVAGTAYTRTAWKDD